MCRGLPSIVFAFVSSSALTLPALGQTFTGLGGVPGTNGTVTSAFGASADGAVVVGTGGYDSDSYSRGFSWSATTGMLAFGVGIVWDANSDGSVIVGTFDNRFGPGYGFRQASDGGQSMGVFPGAPSYGSSTANGVSDDGQIVVGGAAAPGAYLAYRWTIATGLVSLGTLPGGNASSANGISANGLVIVGYSEVNANDHAFRWTQNTGMVDLGTLPGGTSSIAMATNADGSVVIGNSTTAAGTFAFRWTDPATGGSGMVSLGLLPDTTASFARGINADGTIIVGYCTNGPSAPRKPFIWTPTLGLTNANQLLSTLGVPMTGWELTEVVAVSADGLTFVGTGINSGAHTEPWRATLLSAPTCGSADFNCDGDVGTDADIESFFACLAGSCPAAPCTSNADFNGDGDTGTDADIEAFFRVLAGGTC